MICSNYKLQQRDPDFFFQPLSYKSELRSELQELSHLIPLNQETAAFVTVARHYDLIRFQYTKDEFGGLVTKETAETSDLTAHTLLKVFTKAYRAGVFSAAPVQGPFQASASAAACYHPNNEAESSSEVHPKIGTLIATNKLGESAIEFYVSLNSNEPKAQLSIVRILPGVVLGKSAFSTVYKVLNVSEGIFEGLKIAKNKPKSILFLKNEYAILRDLQKYFQKNPHVDCSIQVAPHQLIAFPIDDQTVSTAYLVKLYLAQNLEEFLNINEVHKLVPFYSRIDICLRLMRSFQILSKLGVLYSDICTSNILLTLTPNTGLSCYIGDFGGVEPIAQFQENLQRQLTVATPLSKFPDMIDITKPIRAATMSLQDYAQLSEICIQMRQLVLDVEKTEQRIAQFKDRIFPQLLDIKAKHNVFALGTLCCEILTGGTFPYPLDDHTNFPLLNAEFNEIPKIRRLKTQLPLPDNPLYFHIAFLLIKWMLSQNPEDRPSLDDVMVHWNTLVSTHNVSALAANNIVSELAATLKLTKDYSSEEKEFLKSKLGTYLMEGWAPEDDARLIDEYQLDEYVITARSNGRFQVALIKTEGIRPGYLTLFDGFKLIEKSHNTIYTFDIDLLLDKDLDEELIDAPAAPVIASASSAMHH